MASRVDIQISILKFNFQPRFWFHFPFPYRGWLSNMVGQIKISISESDFDFQIFISPFHLAFASPNVVLVHIILCLWLCRYVIYYALHYVYTIYIFNTLYIISLNHFTFFLINIVTLYTFFQRVCATFTHFSRQFYVEWCTKTRYIFDMLSDIWCTEPHFVPPASCTLSHFVAFTFHTSFNITL